ncbi:3670_t:CDS:2, partial [Racocetra persica]
IMPFDTYSNSRCSIKFSMFHHRWLSPICLNCSFGHAKNANYFTHYHYLTGAFGLSKNISACLKTNNRFFKEFDRMFFSIIFTHPLNVFPTTQ